MKVLLIASYPESILAFRGPLVEALVACGSEVHVAAPGITALPHVGGALEAHGATVHDIPLRRTGTNPLADAASLVALVRLIRKLRPDVTLPYTIKPVVYGTLAAWLAGVPRRFALVTGLGYAFTGERQGPVKRIISLLYRFALAKAHKVFFQNPDDERLFRHIGLLPSRVRSVVVNGSGIDIESHRVQPLPAGTPTYLMIGRLLGDKGVREYAQAAARVKQRHPNARFLLVGWIDANPDAIAPDELDGWRQEGVIEFLGKLDDVRPAIAASTVYVLPSYREGTPRTVLEAMAMGRPIITTDAPGCRETVIDGENGYLVPVKSVDALADAMLRFIDDPGLAPRMGKRSREIAEDKYDVHKINAVMLREMGIAAVIQDSTPHAP
ncbi:MAG: glycosyltransferase family 1 protein [Rubrivivax sp.]|nr:MAG: glycosyltransferase family 1 protein [Rubrivivax sp.]